MKSTINVYEGYSKEVANGYARSSVHVPVDDGCRIAVDILRPACDGAVLAGPRPTVVQATGYRRAYYKKENEFNAPKYAQLTAHLPVGALITAYEQRPACQQVIHHGYNVVSVDFRGTGASFGTHANQTWRIAADIAQVVDWIAGQGMGHRQGGHDRRFLGRRDPARNRRLPAQAPRLHRAADSRRRS